MTVRYNDKMRTDEERTTHGTRAELVAELNRLAEGFSHLGKSRLSREARDGVYDLETGCTATQVGHTLYKVTDPVPGRSIPTTPRSTDRA